MAKGSKMIEAHIKALQAIGGKTAEAGWFESARYKSTKPGEPGIQVAAIARLQNYGGVIDHPGGTKYIRDAATADKFLGTRFVKKDFQGEHEVTQPHQIVIPARPFMQLAWANFSEQRKKIQEKIARDLVSGKITPDKALGQIAEALEGCIAKSIVKGNWQANAKSTIAKKGFDKPLVNTSFMLQSLTNNVF